MSRKKGSEKTGGRTKGVQNKFTVTVKETVLKVFNEIQDDPDVNLKSFAKTNPKDFYQIAARLIPTEISGDVRNAYVVEIIREDDPNNNT